MGIVELNAEYIYIYKSITKRSQEEVNGQWSEKKPRKYNKGIMDIPDN